MDKKFPPRLHILLSSKSDNALVIRRGPSDKVCFIRWDRKKGVFTQSQCLKGRIYERRSDLSPDGKHIIYFAMNGKWGSETKGAWTAISRYPWMKAIGLYAKGDCWNGGGIFLDSKNYWLNDGYGHDVIQQTSEVVKNIDYRPVEYYGGECTGVYYLRLQRDGWALKKREEIETWNSIMIFEKPLPKGWVLRKIAHEQVGSPKGKGCYWDEHELINSSGEIKKHHSWEWAEFNNKRLIWAEDGILSSCSISTGTKLGTPKELYDFNDMGHIEARAPY